MDPQIRLLGGQDLRGPDAQALHLPTRKSWALLAYLLHSGGRAIPREEIATLLWARSGEDQARASLRQELAVLRKALDVAGLDAVEASKETLRFAALPEIADTLTVEKLVEEGTLHGLRRLPGLCRGEFLAGLNIRSDPFEDWLWLERQRLRDCAVRGLLHLLQSEEANGEAQRAAAAAEAILAAEPVQEEAHRALMRLHRRAGRRAEALRQFERCRKVLRDALDAAPSRETEELADAVRRGVFPAAVPGFAEHQAAAEPSPVERLGPVERREIVVAVFGLADLGMAGAGCDAEDFARAQADFQTRCARLIDDFGGHAEARFGGLMLASFGYPRADEHDCERAALAALSVVCEPVELPGGQSLGVRCGIARGDTLITPLERGERGLSGAAVHVAMRLEQQGGSGQVIVSPDAHRLIATAFETEALPGAGRSDGTCYLIRRERLRASRFDTSRLNATLSPLTGRDGELAVLGQLWARARLGRGRIAVIRGEPGIGKSRLCHAFVQSILPGDPAVIQIAGSPLHRKSAFFAIRQYLEEELGLSGRRGAGETRRRLEGLARALGLERAEVTAPVMALLDRREAGGDTAPGQVPPEEKGRLFEALLALLTARAAHRPLLLIVEDLHWLDPMTSEFLDHLVGRIGRLPVLVVATTRPADPPGWFARLQPAVLELAPLPAAEARRLIAGLLPPGSAPERIEALIERADGVPLHIEELARSGAAAAGGQAAEEDARAVPDGLQASLMARIDRLAPAREVLQVMSVMGKVFDHQILRAATGLKDETLNHYLRQLQAADLVYRVGRPPYARYEFKHALVQDMVYQTLLKAQRRSCHLRVAQAMEAAEAGGAGAAGSPEVIAGHYRAAGRPEKAIGFFEAAGKQAVRVSAHLEAAAHFRAALDLVHELGGEDGDPALELKFLLLLGPQILAAEGFASDETVRVYDRARALVSAGPGTGDPSALGPVLWGLWGFYVVRADIRAAMALGTEFLDNAQALGDPVSIVAGHYMLGVASFYRGRLADAAAHFNAGEAQYSTAQHAEHVTRYGLDLCVSALSYLGWVQALMGLPDKAAACCRRAIDRAEATGHTFSLAFAQVFTAGTHLFLGDDRTAETHAAMASALARGQGFAQWQAQAVMQTGRAEDRKGDARGLDKLRRGLEAYRDTGAALATPYAHAWLAEALGRRGLVEQALARIAEAEAHGAATGEVYYDAELLRLKAVFLDQQGESRAAEAEAAYGAALAAAKRSGANLLLMRASVGYAEFLKARGRAEESHQVLQDALPGGDPHPHPAEALRQALRDAG